MDGLYSPDGRQLALIDRDWILDELPHLGNPDDNSDVNYLLASAAVANSGTGVVTAGRNTSGIGTGGGSSHGTGGGAVSGLDSTGTGAGGNTGVNHHGTGAGHNHSLLYNPEEFEGDLTLLSEIVDETQNKWSDFGLNQLLTPYARVIRPAFK